MRLPTCLISGIILSVLNGRCDRHNLRSMMDIEKRVCAKCFVDVRMSLLTDIIGVEHASEVNYRFVISTREMCPALWPSLFRMQHFTTLGYTDGIGHPRHSTHALYPDISFFDLYDELIILRNCARLISRTTVLSWKPMVCPSRRPWNTRASPTSQCCTRS